MRQSELFTKTIREASKDEVSINAKLLIRGGFVDKLMAGVYSLLPLGWRVIKKIENIIREEMVAIGGQEIFMPALHPKANWEKTGRWATYDDLYRVKENNKEYAVGPTHEEIIVPLAKKFIHSYSDLPVYIFQIQNKFRKELRAKSGLLRGREFIMKDLYSFHTDETDLDDYYERMKEAYFKIFKRVGIADKTILTYSSGGTFSKYSHEFQTLTPAGEDTIYICDKCQVAVNKEIISEVKNQCPNCNTKDLRSGKAIEVGNIFKIKTKFSEPFDLFFVDENGKRRTVTMGCYGIGLQRLMGTIVELYNDDKGIVWPEEVAPFKVHLLILDLDKAGVQKEVRKNGEQVYQNLTKAGIEVLYDDRKDRSAGEKFVEADLIGIPYRVVVSEKTIEKDSVEIKKRNEKNVVLVKQEKLLDEIKSKIQSSNVKS